MSWIDEKDQLLSDLNHYIKRVSNLDPVPLDYVADLQQVKALVEIANQEELKELQVWWQDIKPNK